MPSVVEFVQDEATTTIHLSNGRGATYDVEITYRPSAMTADATDQMARRDSDGDVLAFLRMFEDVVIEWDIEGPLTANVLVKDDAGNPVLSQDGNELFERQILVAEGDIIPIDVNYLKYIPSPTLVGVWRGLVQEQSGPDPQRSRGSRRR